MSDLWPGWTPASIISGLVTFALWALRRVRHGSRTGPSLWTKFMQLGLSWLRLEIAESEVEFLKDQHQSHLRERREWTTERAEYLEELVRLRTENRDLRGRSGGTSSPGSSAGPTRKRGESTRRTRDT